MFCQFQHVLAFSAKYTSLCETAFSAADQHVLIFSHREHHFNEFVRNSVFSRRSARFDIFPPGHHFKRLSTKCTTLYKTGFSAKDQHVFSFLHWACNFFALFSRVHEFIQNSVFSRRAARTVIFALGTPLFNSFQQSISVCPKQIFFQPQISTCYHVCTGWTTF